MSSLTVARIRGIAIEVHWSWLAIVGLLSWSLADIEFPERYPGWTTAEYVITGTTAAVLLFVTVLIHELAHAIVAQRRGLEVPKITLFIFGGVSSLAQQPRSAGEEFAIAAAGPATSVAIAVISGLALLAGGALPEQVRAVLGYLALVNVSLALFNLLPGFPLDGGRVLRSIVWKRTQSFPRATRIAASSGQMVGYLMMAGGLVMLFSFDSFGGVWLAVIGWFLVGAARAEYESQQLESVLGKITARDIMRTEWPTVSPGTSVDVIVNQIMIGDGERAVIVASQGAVGGIFTVSDVRKTNQSDWPTTPVDRVMTPREKVVTVPAATPAMDVLMLMGRSGLNQVPVLEEGRMIGLIGRRELLERVQLARSVAGNDRGGAS